MIRLIECLCLPLRRAVSAVVIALFAVMMASVLVQVGGRYLFGYPVAPASEIATFCQIWLVLLGSGVAIARSQHVAIDMLPAAMPLRVQRVLLAVIAAVTLGFLWVLGTNAGPLIKLGGFQTSPTLQIPMKYMYMCLPAGAAYMALEVLLALVQRWSDPFPEPSIDEEAA
ncbi:TRAP transporter small permease [Poseidonocella sp. HB161398]|uniref:TRAP transporter small permease n=1 Tax=Poseidonocella sp. HB161398 TaxID=2320855 RepID=UPI00110959D5|nr:TRAP transporter small permease [Poseidonocella sp. HB161398]